MPLKKPYKMGKTTVYKRDLFITSTMDKKIVLTLQKATCVSVNLAQKMMAS